MASEESESVIQEEEVFEITDFTNATDWEKFIAQIDEKIIDWQLNRYSKLPPLGKNEFTSGEWETLSEKLSFANVPFNLTLYRLKQTELEQFEEVDNEDDFQLPRFAEDAMDRSNDFPARAHCLARWYGLRCFLVISPITSSGVLSESKTSLLLSSSAVSLNNTLCDVPMFVQIQEGWRRMYTGHAASHGVQTQYEMVHLKKTPVLYSHLSGLLQVFKSKIGQELKPPSEIQISTRFTFVLNDWGREGAWPVKVPDPDTIANHFSSLLTGCLEEPVVELQLACTWPSQTADVIIDNRAHSNFDAFTAPSWSIRLRYADEVSCLLSCYLHEFLKTAERKESLNDLVRFHDPVDEEQDIGQALDKLTDPSAKTVIPIVPTKLASGISKVVSNPQGFLRRGAYTIGRISMGVERINPDVLQDIMTFIFSGGEDSSVDELLQNETSALHHKLKAAPVGSLTHRLAVCAVVVNLCHGGIWALAQLWHAFVTELRRLLDNSSCLNGIESSKPDLKACLLHQKLQMLNCCILKKSIRDNLNQVHASEDTTVSPDEANVESTTPESALTQELEPPAKKSAVERDPNEHTTATDAADEHTTASETVDEHRSNVPTLRKVPSVLSDSEEDEFFECDSDVEASAVQVGDDKPSSEGQANTEESLVGGNGDASQQITCDVTSQDTVDGTETIASVSVSGDDGDPSVSKVSSTTSGKCQPAGRLHECNSLKLLYEPVPLYVPVTQEHAPQTEDQLEEQAEVFSKLGDTKEGSEVRAKMQSTSLLSDMEAFKAANPGCVLEDFVRWYSPRDFEDGCLSQRMRIPGNLWVTSWSSARPVPAHRQKRLFDDTKEAEKVLHFLTNLKPAEITQLLLPVCIHEVLLKLRAAAESMTTCLKSLPLLCHQIENRASHLFQTWKMSGPISNMFNTWSKDDKTKVEDLVRQISFAENLVERAKSLQHKFVGVGDKDTVNAFVRRLLEHPEVQLDGAGSGVQGCMVKMYFQSQQARFQESMEAAMSEEDPGVSDVKIPPLPTPAGREFIIRTKSPYPSAFSREVPHRLYAVLTGNEFRLASATSSDTTFF